jgi:hypothetical protein
VTILRRKLLIGGFMAGLLILTAGAAFAGQVNGTGKSALGNTIGFNAKSNLTGSFEYNGDPNGAQSNINAHCNDYSGYLQTTYVDKDKNPGTYPMVKVSTSGCADQLTGQTYRIVAALVDEGEPGTYDFACIRVFDKKSGALLVHDLGYIQNGNIQIHVDTKDLELFAS